MSDARSRPVTAETAGRLDAVVRAALPAASRRLVRALIADGRVRVNGRRATKGTLVAAGDVVLVPELPALAPEPALRLHVLHEDADLVAIDKPGGVPGHALDPGQRGTMAGALVARYPELAGVGAPGEAGLVHRLDTGTSGVLVAARSPAAHAALRAAFRAHGVAKTYVAVVDGVPRAGTVVDVALAHDPRDRRRMRPAQPADRAWPAATRIATVEAHGPRALVSLELRSGVTHQVRVHLAHAGHPIVGDALYGGAAGGLPPGRHALHAAVLEIAERRLRIAAPLPDDLRALLAPP